MLILTAGVDGKELEVARLLQLGSGSRAVERPFSKALFQSGVHACKNIRSLTKFLSSGTV